MALFLQVDAKLSLPPGLLQSICFVETKHNVNAYHANDGQGNSVGICQIKLKTAQDFGFKGTEKQLMEPKNNIYYAGKYLQHQINRYKAINKGVIAYNFGHAGKYTTTEYQRNVYGVWKNGM